MKNLFKISIVVAAMLFTTSAFAQKGEFRLGGQLGFSSTTTKLTFGGTSEKSDPTTSFSIMPNATYFISDNIALGLGLSYGMEKSPNGNGDDCFDKVSMFLINPHFSYVFGFNDKFSWIPEFGFEIGFGKLKTDLTENTTSENNLSEFDVYLQPIAFEYRCSSHIALQFKCGNVGYVMNTVKVNDYKGQTGTFQFNINMEPTLGFVYIF